MKHTTHIMPTRPPTKKSVLVKRAPIVAKKKPAAKASAPRVAATKKNVKATPHVSKKPLTQKPAFRVPVVFGMALVGIVALAGISATTQSTEMRHGAAPSNYERQVQAGGKALDEAIERGNLHLRRVGSKTGPNRRGAAPSEEKAGCMRR
jgi:hypothetical protein